MDLVDAAEASVPASVDFVPAAQSLPSLRQSEPARAGEIVSAADIEALLAEEAPRRAKSAESLLDQLTAAADVMLRANAVLSK